MAHSMPQSILDDVAMVSNIMCCLSYDNRNRVCVEGNWSHYIHMYTRPGAHSPYIFTSYYISGCDVAVHARRYHSNCHIHIVKCRMNICFCSCSGSWRRSWSFHREDVAAAYLWNWSEEDWTGEIKHWTKMLPSSTHTSCIIVKPSSCLTPN